MNPRLIRLFWQCHSACAIYTGGFISFILLTGAFAVFADDIDRWIHRDLDRSGARILDLGGLPATVAHATASLSEGGARPQLTALRLPEQPGHSVQASFYNEAFRAGSSSAESPWMFRRVFLHPETGAIRGVIEDDRSVAEYLRLIHVRLFAGTPGRNFVGLFGLALTFVSITGVVILGRFLAGRALWAIRRRPARAANADWHKAIGFLLLLPSLLFALTGFWLGMQGRLMQWFSIERPESYERAAVIAPEADAALAPDLAAALARAREVHPTLVVQELSWSTDGSRTLQVRGRIPGTVYERLSQGLVFDKADLTVLKLIDTPNADWREKLFYVQEGLHFGDWGGIWLKLAYLIVGILLGLLPLTGYAIQRMRTRRSLVPFWSWIGFGVAYSAGMLALLKWQGLATTVQLGTLTLWLFVAGLATYWLFAGLLRNRRPRSEPAAWR